MHIRWYVVRQVSFLRIARFLTTVRSQKHIDLCREERFVISYYKLYFNRVLNKYDKLQKICLMAQTEAFLLFYSVETSGHQGEPPCLIW